MQSPIFGGERGRKRSCVYTFLGTLQQTEEVVLYEEQSNLPVLTPRRYCGLSSLPPSKNNDTTSP